MNYMIVRFRLGNITETRPFHGKLDHHVSAGRKRDGFNQLHFSVEVTKYGNKLYRPVFASIYRDFTIPRLRQFTEISRYPFGSFYRYVTVPRLRQFTHILRYPVCVNLQRFYDVQFVLIYSGVIHRHFMSDVQLR